MVAAMGVDIAHAAFGTRVITLSFVSSSASQY